MSWRSLRAMRHHHETQPLPSRLAPCLHLAGQRIPGAAAVQAVVALTTEFVGAWLLLLPTAGVGGGGGGGGGVANGAVLAQLGLQLGIVCSGGFGFFNLLTAATCVACANDAAWWLPSSSPLVVVVVGASLLASPPPSPPSPPLPSSWPPAWASWLLEPLGALTPPPPPAPPPTPPPPPPPSLLAVAWADMPLLPPLSWEGADAVAELAALALVASAVAALYAACVARCLDVPPPWARATAALHSALSPLGLGASYGAFASVTKARYELVLEGSADGATWRTPRGRSIPPDCSTVGRPRRTLSRLSPTRDRLTHPRPHAPMPHAGAGELPCRWKPCDPTARLRVVRHPLLWLHCPRLDWRLWFAAMPTSPPAWLATYVSLLAGRGRPPHSSSGDSGDGHGGDDPDGAQRAALALLDEGAIRRRDPQLEELRHVRVRRYVYRFAPGAAWGGAPWEREDLGCVLEDLERREDL